LRNDGAVKAGIPVIADLWQVTLTTSIRLTEAVSPTHITQALYLTNIRSCDKIALLAGQLKQKVQWSYDFGVSL